MSRGQRAVQSSAWRRRVQGLACARQVQSKAGEGLAGLCWQFGCTQVQLLGSARVSNSVVAVLRLRIQWGSSRVRESSRHQAQARNTPVQCEAAAAIFFLSNQISDFRTSGLNQKNPPKWQKNDLVSGVHARCRSPHPSRVRGSPHPFSKKGAGSRSPYQFFSNCLWCGEGSQNW